jgi:hypothetical protein
MTKKAEIAWEALWYSCVGEAGVIALDAESGYGSKREIRGDE